ncbi:carboxypeptidase-like regulatory domain-containing protein [Hymenobacter sp. 102]|uniref:carboxypeptidase-like regulatory domain-containing protein n=1 Tax=Hymenobacter sp. 102 TaxID=3403152 RepID=UPI003CF89019
MSRALTLAVPQPCHENWQAMTPAAQGRHCAACNKVVVDFTRMTDAEVVAYLTQASGRSCGRFRAEQLQRPLRVATEAPVSRRWLAAALAVLGLGAAGPVAAQTRSAAPQEQRLLLGKPVAPKPASPERVIRGRVTDAGSGEGLPGVTVLLKGSHVRIDTQADGSFELTLPELAGQESMLIFSAVGFNTKEHLIRSLQSSENFVKLQLNPDVKGWAVVTPIEAPRGLWQRLTRPFRR